jgi:long-chain acyl-CoA synthetase
MSTTNSKATRLFDFIDQYAQRFDGKSVFYHKANGAWQGVSINEVQQKVYELATSLIKLGINKGDGSVEGRGKVGLIANNRPEWAIVDNAVQCAGGVLVPIYPTLI